MIPMRLETTGNPTGLGKNPPKNARFDRIGSPGANPRMAVCPVEVP